MNQHKNLINIYRKNTSELLSEADSLKDTVYLYHDFYVKLRTELYNLKLKDKSFFPLFKKVDKFLKKWN